MNSPQSALDAILTASNDRFVDQDSPNPANVRELREDEHKTNVVACNALGVQNQPNWMNRTFDTIKSFVSPLPPNRAEHDRAIGSNSADDSCSSSAANLSNADTDTGVCHVHDASSQTDENASQIDDLDRAGSRGSAAATSQSFDGVQARDQSTQTETLGSKVETGSLCYQMMVERNRSFDRQIEAKSKDLQNALLIQQRLQRTLNKLANLPNSPNANQKKEIGAEIERARADGVEWSDNCWANEQGKNHLLEEIRIRVGELQAGHTKEHTKLTRISDTQHQFVQMFISIMKSLHESKVRMAQAIR